MGGARDPWRVRLKEASQLADVERPPAPSSLASVIPGRADAAPPSTLAGPLPGTDGHHNSLSVLIEHDPFDDRSHQAQHALPYARAPHSVCSPCQDRETVRNLGRKRSAAADGLLRHTTEGSEEPKMFVGAIGGVASPIGLPSKVSGRLGGWGSPRRAAPPFPTSRRRRPTAEEEPVGPEFGGISSKVLGGESRESALDQIGAPAGQRRSVMWGRLPAVSCDKPTATTSRPNRSSPLERGISRYEGHQKRAGRFVLQERRTPLAVPGGNREGDRSPGPRAAADSFSTPWPKGWRRS